MDKQVIALKKRLKKEGKQGIALDIDEVLADTVFHLMENLIKRFGNPENLSARELINKYQYTYYVPQFQTKEARDWTIEEIHRDDIQENLPLIENSNHWVNKVNKIVPICAYLTKRPVSVLPGTIKFLKKHGFPEAEIIAKPLDIELKDGNKLKAEILKYLYPEIRGLVDDDPKFAEFIHHKEYKGTLWLYGAGSYSGENKNVKPCKNWEQVYASLLSAKK